VPSASQQLQPIHTPQSIDQELARLTKDMELTPQQQQQVRPLLTQHHDKIQALLDKNPTASRQREQAACPTCGSIAGATCFCLLIAEIWTNSTSSGFESHCDEECRWLVRD